jgi:poly(3-hydroxybutyrate) depolymerase
VITLDGGGHAWPGMPNKTRALADRPFPFPTAREIWLFFVELRRLPGSPSAPQGR